MKTLHSVMDLEFAVNNHEMGVLFVVLQLK